MLRARPFILLATVLAAALTGCGRDRLAVPDLERPAEPVASITATFPAAGVIFDRPSSWRFEPGGAPLVTRGGSGTAVVAVWRYPRAEPLPRSQDALEDARQQLEDAVKGRDPTFELRSSRITEVDGAPAIVLRGAETVVGQRREVRSVHVYAKEAETVVDMYAADQDFEDADRGVFRPLVRSLKIDPPQP